MARPTFTPSQTTTAATSPQASAPNMVGDFFGATTTEPIILPGAILTQAIFLQPGLLQPNQGLLDYFRAVEDLDMDGLLETQSQVYLGTENGQPVSASISTSDLGQQLLNEFDGTNFTGDAADLIPIDQVPFVALDSGTTANVELRDPEVDGMILPNEQIYNIHDALLILLPSPGAGGGVGRQKIVENTAIFPRDRVFLNYSGFTNVPLSVKGENVHRYVPGYEMAFFEQRMSAEVRLPFAATLDHDIRADGSTDTNVVEFGNVVTTLKALVAQTTNSAVSVGVSATFPTAPDITIHDFQGNEFLALENESVHVLPFIGGSQTNGRWFLQGVVQGDLDTTGSRVLVRNDETGRLSDAGELRDAAFLYASASLGCWVYQNGTQQTTFEYDGSKQIKRTVYANDTWITGFAPLAELHWNRSLEPGDPIDVGNNVTVNSFNQFSLTNLVLGGLMKFGTGGSVMVSWSTPILGEDDRQFDHEVRVALDFAL
ncbi:MAG: hypothetical protein KDA52_19825 [Planctomycetaceae bacterium]|nr:hypothetical protein [Planctomycetaceae bacterium]